MRYRNKDTGVIFVSDDKCSGTNIELVPEQDSKKSEKKKSTGTKKTKG